MLDNKFVLILIGALIGMYVVPMIREQLAAA